MLKPKKIMVDLGGYVIVLAEIKDKGTKLYGTPAESPSYDVGDEILEVNGKTLENATHSEVINHLYQCINSRTICLRVRKMQEPVFTLDVKCANNVQDAFIIALHENARDRIHSIPALRHITPVDMTALSKELYQQSTKTTKEELNGFVQNASVYVKSLATSENSNNNTLIAKSNNLAEGLAGVAAPNTASSSSTATETKELTFTATSVGHIAKNDNSRRSESSCVSEAHASNFAEDVLDCQELAQAQQQHQQQDNNRRLQDRRVSSPFQNGRTELLIGAEDNNKLKTTAVIESNNNKLGVEGEIRPRRRSGSSIVVLDGDLDPVKKPPDDLDDNLDYNSMVMMLSADGPHREMAVDVPESFVARNKTPPRYPPPKPILTSGLNGNAPAPADGHLSTKPVPPPRDHLKIEKDGRLVNRAPAPQLPARITNNNNNITPLTPTAVTEPTREQLNSIKKYQEQIRKRKEEEDRIAAQNEFLNRSLRGSRKLQALENDPQGKDNDAFSDDETCLESSGTITPTVGLEKEIVHTTYGYGDLVASVQRLQLQLKKPGTGGGLSGIEGRVAAVQSLLLSPQFGKALAVHNKVQAVRNRTIPRSQSNAQSALRDCLDCLANVQTAGAVELATLLTGYEFEALMVAHDGVIATLPSDSSVAMTPHHADTSSVSKSTISNSRYGEDNIKIVKIEKSTEPLGATVRNEGDAVVVGRVVRGGAAHQSGLLHEGDEILEVNGVEMRGKSVNTVCDILQTMDGELTFLIVPASQTEAHSGRDYILHVRAHFDYDPEDDMYIPCRELGISFQKGDVLHIISQEDPNWWQAYREGEDDQTLAGLIPSQTFQHQRESMRLAAEERMSKPQRKSSTLLCGKTARRKKKKGAYNEGGYPMYANALEDYDPDEILTYEEVSLYYPRANSKRPIVLIGPPNIGRHELRQRLMEDAERFAAAIPHTSRARKENEVDGQDYHFITRAQFEADILSRKFVEHGEYEKAYYGTSLDAIRSVVNSGKICVLNLHPQSLKILRTSDLKPYVVFVAPPSLEKLRQKKIRNGETYKEEELKDIIEKAREMEDKYGHFFDMVIINNDTERAYHQLLSEINSLEREPQWVPAAWVKVN